MLSHQHSSLIQESNLEMHVKSPTSDAAASPLPVAEVVCDTSSINEFPPLSAALQEQEGIVLRLNRTSSRSMSEQDKYVHFFEKQHPELKISCPTLGSSSYVCDDVGFVLKMERSASFHDFSTHKVSDLRPESTHISSKLPNPFKDFGLQASKRETMSDYVLMKNRLEIQELLFSERILRKEIESDIFSRLQALYTRFHEEPSRFSMPANASNRLLLKHQDQLQLRAKLKNDEFLESEAQFLEEGRRAWKREVKAQEEKTIREMERCKQKKAEDDQFRAAVVFIVCCERNERVILEKEVETAWNEIISKEANERELTGRLMYERLMNSPEQLALAEERERKEIKERKKRVRLQKILQNRQARIIESCHHGRNGSSLLENPGPQKFCFRCRIVFDECLNYYVDMDAKNTSKVPPKIKEHRSTTTLKSLSCIQKKK